MSEPKYYVGIGASAGGLEAIESFFKKMPPDSGLAFVVVQHLSPDYKSLMEELLSKHTRMPVTRAADGQQVEANHIYLIPPKKNLTIFHGKLLLAEQDHSRGVNLPIDIFLRSLAEDQEEKAVGIVLSGTGSDGSRGIRAIKEAGGMLMVQEPESSKFDGMPKSAIATGLPDFVLPPDEMPAQLQSFVKHPYATKAELSDTLLSDEDGLTRIFALLRERCKVDFTFYKPSTVVRRIERRMTVNQVHELRDYVRYLEHYPAEVITLYREMLIGVTNFFRDREAFDYLETQVLPGLLQTDVSREVRYWVAGCSTGEEAYSLAILSLESMERLGIRMDIKIFATDVDRDAVQFAGNGLYPESIAADISPAILSKYFQRHEDSFQVVRRVREMVVFAQHNILKDPPFTNLDLVSCRNLLIYLQPVLQKKALELFSFALKRDGILMLGTSETSGDAAALYEPVHHKWKLYRAKGKRSPVDLAELPPFDASGRVVRPRFTAHGGIQRAYEEERVLERLLQALAGDYVPLAFIVNEQGELLHLVGDASGFLTFPQGKVTNEVAKMAIKDIAIPLTTGLQKCFKSQHETAFSNVRIQRGGETQVVQMRIRPLAERKGQDPLAVVLIEEVRREAPQDLADANYDLDKEAEQRIQDLEHELQFTRENLQATVEELETSNEELQATNEELLASNEELQSTNEELQSVNEELLTVNAEHQSKIQELVELNNDLDNLLTSTDIATLFLDRELCVRRFTPAARRIFDLGESDLGRRFMHVRHGFQPVDLNRLAQQVQVEDEPLEQEIQSEHGHWYLLRITPYRVAAHTVSGVVLTLVNINPMHLVQEALQRSEERVTMARKAARMGYWEWDIRQDRLHWSEEMEPMFGLTPGSFDGRYATFLDAVHPDDREQVKVAMDACLAKGGEYDNEHRILWPDGTEHWISVLGGVDRDARGLPVRMLGMVRDVTGRRETELQVIEQNRQLTERIKELNGLYGTLELLADTDQPIQAQLQRMVKTLTLAWQYPNICLCRIRIGGDVFQSEAFAETPWVQTSPILVDGAPVGGLEIHYLEERPELDEGPFLREERKLIDTLAAAIGRCIHYRRLMGVD